MSLAQNIAWDDTILPFQLDRANIRGRVARLDRTLESILVQHDYPDAVAALVGEAAILTALIGQTIKLRWRLSLQARGDGPVRMVATDYYAPKVPGERARIRAFAAVAEGFDADADGGVGLLGSGYFGITIDQGIGTAPYQGITPLAGDSLAAAAASYFAQSEQLPTRFATGLQRIAGANGSMQWRGGGVLVQHMPAASPEAKGGGSGAGGLLTAEDLVEGEDGEDWNRVNILIDTVTRDELVGPDIGPTDLLTRLFHEEGARVYDSQPIEFGCTCSADKVRNSLRDCGPDEIAAMTTDAGVVTADCQFCGAHYEFAPDTLGRDAGDAA